MNETTPSSFILQISSFAQLLAERLNTRRKKSGCGVGDVAVAPEGAHRHDRPSIRISIHHHFAGVMGNRVEARLIRLDDAPAAVADRVRETYLGHGVHRIRGGWKTVVGHCRERTVPGRVGTGGRDRALVRTAPGDGVR